MEHTVLTGSDTDLPADSSSRAAVSLQLRAATFEDLPALIDLGSRMHAESPHLRRLAFSPEQLRRTLEMVLKTDHGFLCVATADGNVVGVYLALAMEHWCSTDLVTTDLALYVEPAHRGTMLAARLIRSYLRWADSLEAQIIGAAVSTGVHVEQTARLYEAMGMKRFGVLLEA